MTPEKQQAIEIVRRLYIDEGISGTRVAGALGIATATMYKWLALGGHERRTPGGVVEQKEFSVTADDIDVVTAAKQTHASLGPIPLRYKGWPMWRIGEELGCSRDHVRRRLAVAGWGAPNQPPGLYLLKPIGRRGIERLKRGERL